MGYYINKDGNYYEGDRQGEDAEVPQRPSPYHVWQDGEWVDDKKAIAVQRITELEATITIRRIREAALGTDGGWLKNVDDQIAALRATLAKV